VSSIAVGVAALLAGYLLLAAATKAVHPRTSISALVAFGAPKRVAGLAVALAIAIEVCAAFGLLLRPAALVTQATVLTLYLVFALLGLLALTQGRRVECGCLGGLHRSTLGWAQLAELIIVVPALAVVARYHPASGARQALPILFAVEAAVGALLLAHAAPSWWRIRRDRVSLGGLNTWVRAVTTRVDDVRVNEEEAVAQ